MNTPSYESYYLLRAALALFQTSPGALSTEQLAKASAQAHKEYELEDRVLQSPEAASVIVTERQVNEAVLQIRERFSDEESFISELEKNGLTLESLQRALLRQCKVENILESIASKATPVSDVEIDIYYHMHPEKFRRPEQRSARHILITINEEYSENKRENALLRISEIAEKLKHKPHKLAALAMKHSECPTALQGGELGTFIRGQLFPEIEEALFKLKEGQISDIVESEVGFHIVQCVKIDTAESMSLNKARPKIRQLMQERSRRNCQKAWLASLSATSVV
jgi:peptidyl-prolyl cis-trans isomerase C